MIFIPFPRKISLSRRHNNFLEDIGNPVVGIKSLRIYPGEISLVPGSFLTFSISWPS
jgi:hypothetical protein